MLVEHELLSCCALINGELILLETKIFNGWVRGEHPNQIKNGDRFPPIYVHEDQINQKYSYSIDVNDFLRMIMKNELPFVKRMVAFLCKKKDEMITLAE